LEENIMKKHATRIAGTLLSIAMFCIMLGAIIGSFTLNILAAPDSGAYTPRIGRDDIVGNLIYANGTPIYIEAGTSGGTAVYYFDGTAKKYVNESGAKGDDLSNYTIFGGSANLDGLKSNTSVTMSGGEVKAIYGGQKYGTRYGDAVIGYRNSRGDPDISVFSADLCLRDAVDAVPYLPALCRNISVSFPGQLEAGRVGFVHLQICDRKGVGRGEDCFASGHAIGNDLKGVRKTVVRNCEADGSFVCGFGFAEITAGAMNCPVGYVGINRCVPC
jgi:hypothetical protein